MQKISIFFVLLFVSFTAFAQLPGDTIVVKTLDYNSATRDTVVSFPNLPNVSFEKILMRYNMRCKGALVSTGANRNLGCGEWDYSCNTFITDSTKADSLIAKVNSHRISGYSGNSIDWKPLPNLYRYRQLQPNASFSLASLPKHTVGNGAVNVGHAIPTHDYNGRSQYLFTAAELSTAGLTAGPINAFMMNANMTVATNMLRIKMKHSGLNQLNASTPVDTGFQEVFNHNKTIYAFTNGDSIKFHSPFVWDGSSNILVEFSFNWPNGLSSFPTLKGHSTALPMGISSSADQHLLLSGNNYVDVPSYTGISGANDRTVEAWISTKVANKEIITWGNNASSQKWVVRVNGGGQLRVEVNGGYMIGTKILTDSAWHHVAVSFSGTNINQSILYVDGEIDTISSSQAVAVNTNTSVNNVRVGNGTNNTFFEGKIDNVRIWSTALSQSEIKNWMRKKLDNTHPSYSNLELDLSADASTNGIITDASGNNRDGQITANPYWTKIEGKNLFKNFVAYNERPNITFVQGSPSITSTIDTFWFSLEQPPYYMDSAIITSNAGTIMNDAISYSPQTAIWDANTAMINYDELGNFLNIIPGSAYGTINITPLSYYQRNPMYFEIMSFVTPYGINLDLGPTGKTWTFDVTDFTPILKGEKRMLMTMGGQWQEEMDIQFLFIVGTPPADVHDINNIWKSLRSSNYSNINNDVVFPPRDIKLPSNSSSFKVRSSITGHGQQGEFIPRNHHLNIDGGVTEYSWTAWKECADNPVYPQGGTWIYDRAGWCPGMATDIQQPYIDQYVTAGQTHTFDYDVDVASGDSRYIVNHQLVNYGAPNHALDARIIEIMNPSTRVEFARENPICKSPKIVIQNSGSTPLTSLQIKYGLNGIHQMTHAWTGNLDFMKTDTIELDAPIWFWDNLNGPTGNTFQAEVDQPNGGADEYMHNNKMTSEVVVPAVLPKEFIMIYKGNNAFGETKIEFFDDQNNVVLTKVATSTAITFDTVKLGNGCYSMLISDSDDDGISFWANNDGAGFFFLRDYNNANLFQLDGDFGKYTRFNFSVEFPLSYQDFSTELNLKIYPNPADDALLVEADQIENASIEIYSSVGSKVSTPMKRNFNQVQISTSELANGFYFIKTKLGDKESSKKFIIRH